ncbi:hypothetical protein BDA99DRAFT_569786 [Phascolomyces articulosus]|uniref:Uncharacterized protein n=1 Tax=Phascolomyces articulosus TaxID=60185 RepID=A0AAD5PGS8_9FUNG|nr:hypothetical protein BDA99DRAFT_569786 [Phascolomyces articulosus]
MLSKSNFRLFSTTGTSSPPTNTVQPSPNNNCHCTCNCHINNDNSKEKSINNKKVAARNAKNSLTPPRRWLERICRRPSLSSSSSEEPPSPTTEERTRSLLHDFQQLYQTVQEEIAYATESQGSIYYEDDLITAKRALGDWLDCYDELVHIMKGPELLSLHIEWEASRNELNEKLKKLPTL